MINLLPPTGKKTVSREYWLRIITVWAFLFFGLFVIFFLLLIPTYVLSHSLLRDFQGNTEHAESVEGRYTAAESKITETNKVIEQLATPEARRNISALLDAVYEVRTPHVVYRNISLERKNGAVKKIQVQGDADTRADLIALRSSLERLPIFTNVSIPLSDLARDVDLPFVITISVADGSQ